MALSVMRLVLRSPSRSLRPSSALVSLLSGTGTGITAPQEPVLLYKTSFGLQSQQVRCWAAGSKSAHSGPSRAGRREQVDSDSDSDSDSDREGSRKERGDSEFWRRKMRTLHGLLDLNKDGVISFDDYRLLANRFVDLGHLSPQDTTEFHKSIQEMWEEQWGSVDPYNLVTTEQYLTEMHHILNDKSLKKKAHKFLPFLFKAVDKDKSGEISVEEFKIFFQCLGLSEQDAVSAFNVIDTNTDGLLSLKEFVKLGKDFFITEDARRPSKMFWGPLVP